jgi:hypothetical protein
LLRTLSKEDYQQAKLATRELQEFGQVLEKASVATDKKEVKKLGLKGFIKSFSNGLSNIYGLISDTETIESLKKSLHVISDSIDKIS